MSSSSEVNNPYGPDAQFDLDRVRHAAFIFFDQPEAVVTPLRADRDLAWFRVDAKPKPSALIVLANEGLRSIYERLVREFELLRNMSCGSVVHALGINHDRGQVALFLEWPGDRNVAQFVQERSETSTDLRSILSVACEIAYSVPLLAIAANGETSEFMLSADPRDLEGARRMSRRCQRNAKRAGETLKRVRSLFGEKARTIEPIDINDVLREVLALASNQLQMNDVTVQTTFCWSLPAASGDRVQIQQVVLNLLLNALEAMKQTPATDRNVALTTGLGHDGTIQVDVRDNGTGIQLGMNEKLFEAFYTTKEQGMGVGLSVSRAIIESLGRYFMGFTECRRGSDVFVHPTPAPRGGRAVA